MLNDSRLQCFWLVFFVIITKNRQIIFARTILPTIIFLRQAMLMFGFFILYLHYKIDFFKVFRLKIVWFLLTLNKNSYGLSKWIFLQVRQFIICHLQKVTFNKHFVVWHIDCHNNVKQQQRLRILSDCHNSDCWIHWQMMSPI